MEIAINHLTRMKNGRFCAAGIDLSTKKHVRPILSQGLPVDLLERNGGPFDIGNIVDLGATQPAPQRPKYEDHYFKSSQAKKIRIAKASGYWKLLEALTEDDLATIFGNELVITPSHVSYLPNGRGAASLGCYVPLGTPSLRLNDFYDLKLSFEAVKNGEACSLDLKVTDIRFYEADHATPNVTAIEQVNERIEAENLILGLGSFGTLAPSKCNTSIRLATLAIRLNE